MPRLGAKSTCKLCGEPIQFLGDYWKHLGSSPRHPAIPVADKREKQAKKGKGDDQAGAAEAAR